MNPKTRNALTLIEAFIEGDSQTTHQQAVKQIRTYIETLEKAATHIIEDADDSIHMRRITKESDARVTWHSLNELRQVMK